MSVVHFAENHMNLADRYHQKLHIRHIHVQMLISYFKIFTSEYKYSCMLVSVHIC